MLILGVIVRIRSSFIALLWVFFASIGNALKSKLFSRFRGEYIENSLNHEPNFSLIVSDSKWLLFHIFILGLPFVQCFYLIIDALYLFIPIMGRAGGGSHAEILIAFMVSSMFATLFSFVVPLVLLVRGAERIFSLLTGLFLISLAALILTPLGFPYSGEHGALAPQRFMMAVRIFFKFTSIYLRSESNPFNTGRNNVKIDTCLLYLNH